MTTHPPFAGFAVDLAPLEECHCVYCGRQMVDVEEKGSLFDSVTGERIAEVWRQCPKFPRNGFMFLFTRGVHQSYSRDNPMLCRSYV